MGILLGSTLGGSARVSAGTVVQNARKMRGGVRADPRAAGDSYCDQTRTRVAVRRLVIDDERRPLPLEVVDGEPQILEVHLACR